MKKYILHFSWFLILFFLLESSICIVAQERKISKTEKRADRNFIRQRFDKAMAQYETVVARESNEENKALMHLKNARLYFMLRDYVRSSVHYAQVMQLNEALLSVEDVCEYVDALRFIGENRKAEGICLNHAYKDIYSRYQRFQNTFDALSMRHSISSEPGFLVKKPILNSPHSEFWIGKYDNKLLFAKSYSDFNDPSKLFFHRTHYYALRENEEGPLPSQKPPRYADYVRNIPTDMQGGPFAFAPDLHAMVATVIHYDKSRASIDVASRDFSLFQTRLLYSTLKHNQRRFTKYVPLFPQEEGYSYAHPYFLNEGKSLLFTSNMPGGHGGFDLYIIHFDESTQAWGNPINLGPEINTEGDEIFPVFFDGQLIFSSNGLPGFGGYDLFSMLYDKNSLIPGTRYHFPHPVNSEFNDYYMLPVHENAAYFISDRDLVTRDDVYYLTTVEAIGKIQDDPLFGMNEDKAMANAQLLLSGLKENVVPEQVAISYEPKGLLFTLYFDFDSSVLTAESIETLSRFADEMHNYNIKKLSFHGYADEFGGEQYNLSLSERRAATVAGFLQDIGISLQYNVTGHGRLKLTPQEVDDALVNLPRGEKEQINWIQVNRRARRVEVYNN